ncbi:MAG TPA: hypothetical protein ENN54_00085 [Thermoplasmatales archaeon]|nr:hypothetical protein [Thermoplasmatales archaeon]
MKHNAAVIFVVTALLLAGWMPVQGAENECIFLTLSFSPPVVFLAGDYVQVSVEEADGLLAVEGAPEIPYLSHTFTLPWGSRVKEVTVTGGSVHALSLAKKMVPAAPAQMTGGATNAGERKEGPVYASAAPYPGQWAEWEAGAGIRDGQRSVFLSVHVYPVRYLPASHEIRYLEEATVQVSYVPGTESGANDARLLVIAPSEFTGALQPLADHKESWGVPTQVATLNQAYGLRGRDAPEKIKYFIKDAVERDGITHVLLVGDAQQFPVRLSHTYDGHQSNFVSDLYYADLYNATGGFSSWDTNGNDLFGEYEYQGRKDEMDLYPDVYLGRLACSNLAEVETVVNKIITYENTAAGQEWFSRAILCAGDSHEDDEGVYEGEYTKERGLRHLEDFSVEKLYASEGNLDARNIRQAISQGAGLVDFSGHGNRYSWATHPPGDFDTWVGIDVSDVALLTNTHAYPVVILDACSTGEFEKGNCLAWQFVKTADRGAIACYASTALSWGYLGEAIVIGLSGYLDIQLTKYVAQRETAGAVLAHSIHDYLSSHPRMSKYDYKTVQEFSLFGDPSLVIGGQGGCSLSKPLPGYLYLFDKQLIPTLRGRTVILGGITVQAAVGTEISSVEFYVDGELMYTDRQEPFAWTWDERALGRHTLSIVGSGPAGSTEQSLDVIIFNL